MEPLFRRHFTPALLRSDFSVEIARPVPITGSCALRASFDFEEMSTSVAPPLAQGLKRRSSRSHVQFIIPKPEGEAGRVMGSNGKKGYILRSFCTQHLGWSMDQYDEVQV